MTKRQKLYQDYKTKQASYDQARKDFVASPSVKTENTLVAAAKRKDRAHTKWQNCPAN